MCSDTKLSVTEFRRQLTHSLVRPTEKPKFPKKRIHTFIKPEGPGRKRRQNLKASGLTYREVNKKVRGLISYCSDCSRNCFLLFNKYLLQINYAQLERTLFITFLLHESPKACGIWNRRRIQPI